MLLGLCTSPTSRWGRIVEYVVVLVLGLSGPLIVFYSPIFVYRWLRERTRWNAGLIAMVAVAAVTEMLVYLGADRAAGDHPLSLFPRIYLQRVVAQLLGSPDAALTAFDTGGALSWAAGLWFVVVLVVVLSEVRWDAVAALGVTGLALAGAVRT